MKPDMWREFFKEPYRRFYGYIRSRGVIAIHHADSYLVPIVDDMAEIGIQVWQGTLPENDIPALQRHLSGKLTLMVALARPSTVRTRSPMKFSPTQGTRSRAIAPAGTSFPRSPTALPVRSSRTWISTSIRP